MAAATSSSLFNGSFVALGNSTFFLGNTTVWDPKKDLYYIYIYVYVYVYLNAYVYGYVYVYVYVHACMSSMHGCMYESMNI